MIHICICDDNDTIREEICHLIKKFGEKNNISVGISQYSSGEEMLFSISGGDKIIDIVFMDILMKKLDGIETAAQLRQMIPAAQIVFLTVSKEHVFEALEVMPLHYLVKQDLVSEKLERVLLKAVSLAEKNKKEMFTYKFGKVMGSVPLCDIIYFEVKNRIIEMHLRDRSHIEFYCNLTDLEEQLHGDNFERVHRSYIVNFENVDFLSGKELVCTDKTVITIGQKYIAAKDKYQSFLLSNISVL